jgi:hypothetical protein
MRTLKSKLVLILLLLVPFLLQSQTDCKVLKKEIAGNYEGDCKKGLAHGKGKAVGTDTYEGQFRKGFPNGNGTYTGADGSVFIGDWKNGIRDGEGTLTYQIEGRDTTIAGLWKDDIYIGPKPEKPEVKQMEGLDRYSIDREGNGSRILIDIYMNGSPNATIENLSILSTSGSEFSMGRSIGYENINFPVVVKISYKTWNKMHTSQHYVSFEFEIKQEGNWKVVLTN